MIMEAHFAARQDKLFYYSEATFIKKIKQPTHELLITEKFSQYLETDQSNHFFIEIKIAGEHHYFLVEFLPWDTEFFGKKIHKLFTVLFSHQNFEWLVAAIKEFKTQLQQNYESDYCFGEIPSEDTFLLQALTTAKFKLVETRLSCYFDLSKFSAPRRYAARKATLDDIASLRRAAATMKNPYDRFHADVFIDEKKARELLAQYIDSGVRGFLDSVLVPAIDDNPPDAFVSYNYQEDKWEKLGCRLAKLILTAVSFETRRGWFYRLSVEMLQDLKDKGLEYAYFQTQGANRVMYRTMEKLGSKYGCSSHILSI